MKIDKAGPGGPGSTAAEGLNRRAPRVDPGHGPPCIIIWVGLVAQVGRRWSHESHHSTRPRRCTCIARGLYAFTHSILNSCTTSHVLPAVPCAATGPECPCHIPRMLDIHVLSLTAARLPARARSMAFLIAVSTWRSLAARLPSAVLAIAVRHIGPRTSDSTRTLMNNGRAQLAVSFVF